LQNATVSGAAAEKLSDFLTLQDRGARFGENIGLYQSVKGILRFGMIPACTDSMGVRYQHSNGSRSPGMRNAIDRRSGAARRPGPDARAGIDAGRGGGGEGHAVAARG